MKHLISIMMLFISALTLQAQQYSGMSGLIHVPSAEMDSVGDARIGAHFLHKYFTPNTDSFTEYPGGNKINTFDAYISLTPFWWMEIGYAMTFERRRMTPDDRVRHMKDRHFSVKLNPLREGRWWPAVACGIQDVYSFGSRDHVGLYSNYYIAATKHLDMRGHRLGFTAVYRYYDRSYNRRWNGVVGGITYSPSFAPNWRAIVEWTGCAVNFGIDCLLWRHILLQASLQDGKYPSAGLCYKVNLF